ncbi:MAG: hypothetical protein Kow0032_28350 [Methyloligellaceae bacterium]
MFHQVFPLTVYQGEVAAHGDMKEAILAEIYKLKDDPRCLTEGGGERVFSDYRLGNDPATRTYKNMVLEAVRPNIQEFSKEVGGKEFEMGQIWFQHYEHHSFHNTHHHWPALYSVVYYLQFDPKKHNSTTFVNPMKLEQQVYQNRQLKSETQWRPKVKEGDMIIFPSYLDHFAPMCQSKSPRTIVSFNFDLKG